MTIFSPLMLVAAAILLFISGKLYVKASADRADLLRLHDYLPSGIPDRFIVTDNPAKGVITVLGTYTSGAHSVEVPYKRFQYDITDPDDRDLALIRANELVEHLNG